MLGTSQQPTLPLTPVAAVDSDAHNPAALDCHTSATLLMSKEICREPYLIAGLTDERASSFEGM